MKVCFEDMESRCDSDAMDSGASFMTYQNASESYRFPAQKRQHPDDFDVNNQTFLVKRPRIDDESKTCEEDEIEEDTIAEEEAIDENGDETVDYDTTHAMDCDGPDETICDDHRNSAKMTPEKNVVSLELDMGIQSSSELSIPNKILNSPKTANIITVDAQMEQTVAEESTLTNDSPKATETLPNQLTNEASQVPSSDTKTIEPDDGNIVEIIDADDCAEEEDGNEIPNQMTSETASTVENVPGKFHEIILMCLE